MSAVSRLNAFEPDFTLTNISRKQVYSNMPPT